MSMPVYYSSEEHTHDLIIVRHQFRWKTAA